MRKILIYALTILITFNAALIAEDKLTEDKSAQDKSTEDKPADNNFSEGNLSDPNAAQNSGDFNFSFFEPPAPPALPAPFEKVSIWSKDEIKSTESGKFLHFSLYKAEGNEKGATLLVVGGVHGDEPGGYFAPALLASRYKIKKGALWVAPNLNHESLIMSRRGVYGDMNRKFNTIKKDDPDAPIVAKIKEIILQPQVDLVLNLHDGHGFYRERWENTIFNPKSWGQTIVIDQKTLSDVRFGDMDRIASRVIESLDGHLTSEYHIFRVKNTETRYKDEEMRQSLTYFAVTNLKPAFGQETSKNIDALALQIEYHLRSIEEFMRIMDIEFERDFELNFEEISAALLQMGSVKINEKSVYNLVNLRNILRYVPLKGNNEDRFVFDHPLGAVKKAIDNKGERYDLMIGNKRVSSFYPQFFGDNCNLEGANITLDGNSRFYKMGDFAEVKDKFKIEKTKNIRVNVIGFSKVALEDESDVEIKKSDLSSRFSADVREQIYRVEFYKGADFCGTIAIKFP
ncbi:MAG: hypothetical protein LBU73_03190 [Helicobacteraceae bacterium]|jgi:hypothetical protein|nr:hypothetical protein [Helicobacteraceae bacterium]